MYEAVHYSDHVNRKVFDHFFNGACCVPWNKLRFIWPMCLITRSKPARSYKNRNFWYLNWKKFKPVKKIKNYSTTSFGVAMMIFLLASIVAFYPFDGLNGENRKLFLDCYHFNDFINEEEDHFPELYDKRLLVLELKDHVRSGDGPNVDYIFVCPVTS